MPQDSNAFAVTATVAGAVTVADLAVPTFNFPFDVELIGTSLAVGTAPTGATLIANVKVATVPAYSTPARPTIAISAFQGTAGVPDAVTGRITRGTLIVPTVQQVGSTVAGSNLTITLQFRKV